jgi:plastocyanin
LTPLGEGSGPPGVLGGNPTRKDPDDRRQNPQGLDHRHGGGRARGERLRRRRGRARRLQDPGGHRQRETPAATPAAGEGEKLALAASEDGGLSFDPKGLEAKAGTVTVTLDNPSGNQMPHNVVIEGNGVDAAGPIAQPGGTSAATADLKAGTYTFYCAVGQHRQNGMEGELTVE